MQQIHAQRPSRANPAPIPTNPAKLTDLRFKTLIGPANWNRLPKPVQQRFSKRLNPGEAVIYCGQVSETRLPLPGRILSRLLGLVGSPLPKRDGARGSATVIVHEDDKFGGQVWTRIYHEAGRRPQVIHSTKKFAGPTGLEEHIGFAIAMSLDVRVNNRALVFRSTRYFLTLFGTLKIVIPRCFSPGQLEVVHEQGEADDSFSFRLTLTHPLFGLLVSQTAHFIDEK